MLGPNLVLLDHFREVPIMLRFANCIINDMIYLFDESLIKAA